MACDGLGFGLAFRITGFLGVVDATFRLLEVVALSKLYNHLDKKRFRQMELFRAMMFERPKMRVKWCCVECTTRIEMYE